MALGFFCMGVAILNYALVRNPGSEIKTINPSSGSTSRFWSPYRYLFKENVFWIIGAAYSLVGVTVIIPFAFLPVYAREALDLSYAASTRFVAIIALTGLVGQLILGPLSDSIGRVRVMMTCGIFMGAACLGMVLARSHLLLYLISGCFGVGYGAVWSAYGAAASDFFPKELTGGIVGLWTCFYGIGSVIAPVLCGWTIDLTGNYTWTFVMGMCSGVLSAGVLLLVSARK